MNQIQSYYDLYELFNQIVARNVGGHGQDWIGKTRENEQFLRFIQHYNSQTTRIQAWRWNGNVKSIVSQHFEEINQFMGKKICQEFDPHNQISGSTYLEKSFGWIEPETVQNLVHLKYGFRVVQSRLGKGKIDFICCSTIDKNIAVCMIPINSEIRIFLSNFGIDFNNLKFFDLKQAIQTLKTHVKNNQSSKNNIKNLYIKPFSSRTQIKNTCLNNIKTHVAGFPLKIVNTTQTNRFQLDDRGVHLNQKPSPLISKNLDTNLEITENDLLINDEVIFWVEDVDLLDDVAFACYHKFAQESSSSGISIDDLIN